MAKYKIPKDRTDADMLRAAGVDAKRTTATRSSQTQANTRATTRQSTTTDSFHRGFLTPELEERLGKLLLEVKLDAILCSSPRRKNIKIEPEKIYWKL